LLFDLEILLLYPFSVSAYNNDIYGLIVMLIFSIVITIGFVFELGKVALKISNKQLDNFSAHATDKRSINSINYLGNLTSS
jgi:NADH-ubiquinone oxidoreductase chain 3